MRDALIPRPTNCLIQPMSEQAFGSKWPKLVQLRVHLLTVHKVKFGLGAKPIHNWLPSVEMGFKDFRFDPRASERARFKLQCSVFRRIRSNRPR